MQRQPVYRTENASLVDILERILDKGIVIAGDITVKVADIELLTISLRLLLTSVDKAKELGIDWWEGNPFLSTSARQNISSGQSAEIEALKKRIEQLESGEAK